MSLIRRSRDDCVVGVTVSVKHADSESQDMEVNSACSTVAHNCIVNVLLSSSKRH